MKQFLPFSRRITFTAVTLFFSVLSVFGQDDPTVEMADTMRSEGKIYVVVALLASVFVGIAIYMLILERRVKKIERDFRK